MMDNALSNSIKSIARDVGVSVFLTIHVRHEDILYFSYKNRKGNFLSHVLKDNKKDHTAKLFNKPKHPLQPNQY